MTAAGTLLLLARVVHMGLAFDSIWGIAIAGWLFQDSVLLAKQAFTARLREGCNFAERGLYTDCSSMYR